MKKLLFTVILITFLVSCLNAQTVTFTSASQSSASETGTMNITAQLSGISGRTVTVPFSVNGSSTATGSGIDYSITTSPITITAGNTSNTITITITITIASDALDENNETVIVDMGTPTNATQGATTSHTATITDDDASPTVTFTDGSSFIPGIIPGSSDQAIGRFELQGDASGAILTGTVIRLDGGTRTGLTNIKLWSSSDSSFNTGTDIQIGSTIATDPGDGGSVTFSGFSSSISTSGTYYFLTGDIAAGATGAVQGVIVQNTSLTISSGTLSGTISNAELSNGAGLLPVELISFTASQVNNTVTIAWHTATEVNNYGFEVERRVVGSHSSTIAQSDVWEKIGFVSGNGTSNSLHAYSYSDASLASGRYAYRLKQIDNDGTYHYTESVELEVVLAPVTIGLGQNYPNPFNPRTMICFAVATTEHATLTIYNLLGQQVKKLFDGIAEGQKDYNVTFDASQFAGGIYFYKMQTATRNDVRRMLLMK